MTLAQMRTALQARGYGTDTASIQTELINQIYREIASMRSRWSWLDAIVEQDMTAGTVDYTPTAPANIARILWVNIKPISTAQDRATVPLRYMEPQDMFNRFGTDNWIGTSVPTSDRAEPLWYTMFDGKLIVWPAPDQVYGFVTSYTEPITVLSADGDTPLIPTDYHDVLVSGAAYLLAMRERDFASADRFLQEYASRRASLFRDESMRQHGTSVRVGQSGVYDHMDDPIYGSMRRV